MLNSITCSCNCFTLSYKTAHVIPMSSNKYGPACFSPLPLLNWLLQKQNQSPNSHKQKREFHTHAHKCKHTHKCTLTARELQEMLAGTSEQRVRSVSVCVTIYTRSLQPGLVARRKHTYILCIPVCVKYTLSVGPPASRLGLERD